uniref:Uncharacterized protein n=1 Tax=Strigamia maritima TaxID=126957 RepID=T1JNH3_STRMM
MYHCATKWHTNKELRKFRKVKSSGGNMLAGYYIAVAKDENAVDLIEGNDVEIQEDEINYSEEFVDKAINCCNYEL